MAARTPEMLFPSLRMHVGPEVRVYLTSEWELSPYCPSSKLLDSDQQEIYESNMKAMLPAIMRELHRVRPRARHLHDAWKVEGQRSASWLSILPKLAIPPGTSATQETLQRGPACKPASKFGCLPGSGAAATTSTAMSKSPRADKAVKRLTGFGYPLKRSRLPSDPPCLARAEDLTTLQPPAAPPPLGAAVQIQPGRTRVQVMPKPHRHLSSRGLRPMMAKGGLRSIDHLDGSRTARPCEELPISSTVPHLPSSLHPGCGSVQAVHRQRHRGRKLSQQQLDPSVHESGAMTHR
ncbi:hypothetical protein CYMTET_29118 [Cymbomonas tetramitiformis]|uniref:Uncharacterized protein n=1 Tax=Cymbomonas tetramitiformis TaxID=36881 RepID=A0AAE0KV88_9CHLO|nr:hypothetical protein CYMTET_29118 [Cymbomonas tetramitiformis]